MLNNEKNDLLYVRESHNKMNFKKEVNLTSQFKSICMFGFIFETHEIDSLCIELVLTYLFVLV